MKSDEMLESRRRQLAHDLRDPLTVAMGALGHLEELGAGHALTSADADLIRKALLNCRRLELFIAFYLNPSDGRPA